MMFQTDSSPKRPIKEEVRRILLAVLEITARETLKSCPTQGGEILDGIGDGRGARLKRVRRGGNAHGKPESNVHPRPDSDAD